MSRPHELDWRRLPLTGTSLIEASAGTGKTWNIALLYLRLLLERGFSVREVVVTTFTEAAAQELKARLRARLLDAQAALAAPDAPEDELGAHLGALAADAGRASLLARVRLALAEIDLAPIGTIHALCRRVLTDFPFDTGMPFTLGEIVDEPTLVRECVEDYWRARFLGAPLDPWDAHYVLDGGVEALAAVVREILAVDEDAVDHQPTAKLRAWWEEFRASDLEAFRARVEDPAHFKNPDKNVLRRRLRELIEAAQANAPGAVAWDDLHERLDAGKLGNVSPKDCRQPVQTWKQIQPLLRLRDELVDVPARIAHELAIDCARFVRAELRRRLLQRGQSTFSQLIDEVHARVHGPQSGPLLARLQQAWPAALVDEFQDTDARQWAIFERIWRSEGPGGRALLLIGDPKQSIYGFRGGDVASYLGVRDSLPPQRIHTISRNFRSHPRLLLALNALYARAGTCGFGGSGIDYIAVDAGEPAKWKAQPLRHPLRLRLLPAQPHRRQDAALSACADDVAALLQDRTLGLAPGDIAVLLDSNYNIREMRALLAARKVPVVGAGRASVLAGDWAEDLQLLLYALLEPGDDHALRGALATRLLGHSAGDLLRLAADVDAWEHTLEWFAGQRRRWERLGPLAVVESVIHQHAPRLLAAADGERALTDLRHLGELLQEASAQCYGPAELYAWYVAERSREAGGDDAGRARQLRIEGESRRVQLLTVHAAKGLEFPVVLVPMAWRPGQQKSQGRVRYHDAQRRVRLDLGGTTLAAHEAQAWREAQQERLRALYVALTRAARVCVVYAFDDLQPQADLGDSRRGALELLLGAALATLDAPAEERWNAFEAALPTLTVQRETPVTQYGLFATAVQRERRARTPLPAPRPLHGLYSFSALTRLRPESLLEAPRLAEDEPAQADAPARADAAQAHPELAALAGLKGARFGDAVHGLLEDGRHAGTPFAQDRERIRRALDRHSVRPGRGDEEAQLAAVGRLLDRTLDSELAPGLRLGALAAPARRAEFEFAFALDEAQWWRLHPLLAAHGLGDWWPPAARADALRGLMKGYIDLVFAWDGRFHVLDYKSNWLGERLADYAPEALDEAMQAHHYGLQALIYTVALQRYLAQRLPDYEPARHLGESWYLFVRAIGLGAGAGLWRRRFPQTLVDALDALFEGAEDHA